MIKETTPRSWWANRGEPICVLLRAAFPSFHPGALVIGNVQKNAFSRNRNQIDKKQR